MVSEQRQAAAVACAEKDEGRQMTGFQLYLKGPFGLVLGFTFSTHR